MYQTTGKLITVPRRLTKNVQRVGVGAVFHVILHHHVEKSCGESNPLIRILYVRFGTPQTGPVQGIAARMSEDRIIA